MRIARFVCHVSLAVLMVAVAALVAPLARVGCAGPVLWAIRRHEWHCTKALEAARGE